MFALLVIAAAGAFLLGLALLGLGHRSRFDDVERFHRARQMTSAWARAGVTQPIVTSPEAQPREAPSERAEAAER